MDRLTVWREISGRYERVGAIDADGADVSFSYAPEYLSDPSARAISASLPLEGKTFDTQGAACFFDGLLPEGSLRKSLLLALRVPSADVGSLLAGLSDESSGALLFSSTEDDPSGHRHYEPAGDDLLALFAGSPRSTALGQSGDGLAQEGFPEAREVAGAIIACRRDTVARLEREVRAWRPSSRSGR